MIIDFHSHLYRDSINRVYDVSALVEDMKSNAIDFRVVSALRGAGILSQNEYIHSLCLENKSLIPCAVINPKDESYLEHLEHAISLEFKIFEFNSLEHGYRPESLEVQIRNIFEILKKKSVIVKVFTGWGAWSMPDQWRYFMEDYPEIQFVILHLGGVDFRYGTIDLALEYPSLLFETSVENETTALNLWNTKIGKQRLLYGSNYPENYTNLSILKFNDLGLNNEDREKIFYKNSFALFEKKGIILD